MADRDNLTKTSRFGLTERHKEKPNSRTRASFDSNSSSSALSGRNSIGRLHTRNTAILQTRRNFSLQSDAKPFGLSARPSATPRSSNTNYLSSPSLRLSGHNQGAINVDKKLSKASPSTGSPHTPANISMLPHSTSHHAHPTNSDSHSSIFGRNMFGKAASIRSVTSHTSTPPADVWQEEAISSDESSMIKDNEPYAVSQLPLKKRHRSLDMIKQSSRLEVIAKSKPDAMSLSSKSSTSSKNCRSLIGVVKRKPNDQTASCIPSDPRKSSSSFFLKASSVTSRSANELQAKWAVRRRSMIHSTPASASRSYEVSSVASDRSEFEMIHPDMLDESPKDILKRAAEKKIWEEIEDKDNREVLLARSWKTSVGTSTTSSSPRSPLWISEPYSRDMDKVVPNDVLEQPMPRGAQKGDQNAGSGIIIPMQSSLPFIPKPKKEMTEADRSNDDSEVLDELPDRKVSEIADYKITEQTIQVPANSKAHTSIKMNKNSDVKLSKNYTGVVKAPSRRVSFISTKEVYTQAPSTPSMPPPPVTGDHIPSLVFPNNALSPTPINLVTRNLSIFIGEGVSLDPIDPAPESNAGWAMGLSIAVIFVAVFTPFLTLILENIGEGQTECLLCKMWSSFLVGLTTYIILRLFNG